MIALYHAPFYHNTEIYRVYEILEQTLLDMWFSSLAFIYLVLTLLLTHYIGYIMMGSFEGRGNQYILLGQYSALLIAVRREVTTNFPTLGSGFEGQTLSEVGLNCVIHHPTKPHLITWLSAL